MISYERIAQLMDGMFEDAAGIQVDALILHPTNANTSTLDAIQQSLQVGASYNYLDALQNGVNAKLFEAKANSQVSLLNQWTAMQPQLFDATAAASATQKTLDDLKAQTDPQPSADDIAKATEANRVAQANKQGIKDKMDAIKAGQGDFTFSTQTLSAANSSPATTPPATTTVSNNKLLGTPSFTPTSPGLTGGTGTTGATLPPTQQMDTQLRLLWERMMRLLSTIGQPDSVKGQTLEILRFYPSITYVDKDTTTLKLEYAISCEGGGKPTVLDVYPRTSPVNILAEKFKDSGFSLAAAFGFGAANASAAYNHEHLQLTNAMSQTSYVTGFGANSNTFGWLLGKTPGDDTIATGQKEFYALVAIPSGCTGNTFTVKVNRIVWQGANGNALTSESVNDTKTSFTTGGPTKEPTTLTYSPNDGSSFVPVSVYLDHPLDSQARVLVDGEVLFRARDNFARATAAPTGFSNTGLFEKQDASMDGGQWSRTDENRLVILLKSSKYASRFPEIVITSPTDSAISLLDSIERPVVAGYQYQCGKGMASCRGLLPPLNFSSAAASRGVVRRWEAGFSASASDDRILIMLDRDRPTGNSTAADAPGYLVTSSPGYLPWGPQPRVLALNLEGETLTAASLKNCRAQGVILSCQTWSGYGKGGYRIRVYDDQHLASDQRSTNAVQADLTLQPESIEDRKPILESTPLPIVIPALAGNDPASGTWNFDYPIYGKNEITVALRNFSGQLLYTDDARYAANKIGAAPHINNCDSSNRCHLKFTIFFRDLPALDDHMDFVFYERDPRTPAADPIPIGSTQLVSLYTSLAPHLTNVDTSADIRLTGTNLFLDRVRFGNGGPIAELECGDATRTDCRVVGIPTVKEPAWVYLYSPKVSFPLPLTLNGSTADWRYVPPPKPAGGIGAGAKAHVAVAAIPEKNNVPPPKPTADKSRQPTVIQ
ncbi:hypothetical protein [Tunturibacter empetritectus]|uniref:Uncharacterized protein n=1 Tax=Tunturiibacter lichenicola TaxID=2051959 RepID=A0A7W8JBL8_9BACT|nr:hypothetical protein [Edaphobacter lichenicola]MBB5346283.1 hypothetical protein [Edaphobacter lichenicola]